MLCSSFSAPLAGGGEAMGSIGNDVTGEPDGLGGCQHEKLQHLSRPLKRCGQEGRRGLGVNLLCWWREGNDFALPRRHHPGQKRRPAPQPSAKGLPGLCRCVAVQCKAHEGSIRGGHRKEARRGAIGLARLALGAVHVEHGGRLALQTALAGSEVEHPTAAIARYRPAAAGTGLVATSGRRGGRGRL